MKTSLRTLFCLLVLSLGGCLPEERFWWSPDGTRALVAVDSQLHLVTPGGELGAPLSDQLKVEGDLPRHVSWLPDGRGFLLYRTIKRKNWEEVRVLLPDEETKEIERRALGMPGLLSAGLASSGDRNLTESVMALVSDHEKELWSAAYFCAFARQKEAIESILRGSLKGSEFLAEVNEAAVECQIHEICLVKLRGDQMDGEPVSLVRSIRPVLLPVVSPKSPAVAYFRVLDQEKRVELEVCSLDGLTRISVASTTNTTVGWTSDGRSLIFAAPVAEDGALFQNIRKVTVVEESGALAQKFEPTNLAAAIMTDPPRLCVLPDDRVLFSSLPVTLPAPSDGLNLDPRLYVISADGKSVAAVPTAAGDLPTNLSFFTTSPDGKHVAVVESDTDAVAVVEISTGKTEIVSPAHPNWHCRTMPAWKSANELAFAALDRPDGKPGWMLWSQGKGVRAISEKWPAEATARWLEKKEPPKNTP